MTQEHGIWMGRAEVTVLPENEFDDLDEGFAIVNAFVRADSRKEFESELETWLDENALELIEVQDVQPLHDMLNIDEQVMDAAFEAAESGEIAAVFYVLEDPAMEDRDPDVDLLRACEGTRDVVEFRVIVSDRWESGYVVGVSDEWVVIHNVDDRSIMFDGHTLTRLDQVIDADLVEYDDFFARRALELRGDTPVTPAIEITDARSIVESLMRSDFALVRFNDGTDGFDRVGQIEELQDDTLLLHGVSVAGEWVPKRTRHSLQDITRFEVGHLYETTLWTVVSH